MALSTCRLCGGGGMVDSVDRGKETCPSCTGTGKANYADPVPPAYTIAKCDKCSGTISAAVEHHNNGFLFIDSWCEKCQPRDTEGRLIRAAGDVMRAQRLKGIAKYNITLEDQNGYTVGGMIDMVAEELADGSVYVQKVREQYMALLDELENLLHVPSRMRIGGMLADIIKRERGNA